MRVPNERGDLGKYDAVSEKAMIETQAHLVALFVLGGKEGSGFSVSTFDQALVKELPAMLEDAAKQIRSQIEGAKNS